ncbi:MAG: GNAT family N-acetyltransferase [Rhodospirillaceae bacterium]
MRALSRDYVVHRVTWQERREALSSVRREVFIVEQGVPEELEWDEDDVRSVHVLAASTAAVPIGTGRLLPDGRIGRMAVLRSWRRRGVGSAILRALLDAARELGHEEVRLHAQTHALAFYAKHGFVAIGEQFMEAGIPHREMVLRCRPQR